MLVNINNPHLRSARLDELLKLSNPLIDCGGCSILDIIIEIGYYSAIPRLLNEGYYSINDDHYPFNISNRKMSKERRSHSILNRIILRSSTETSNLIINILSKTVEVRRFISYNTQLFLLTMNPINMNRMIDDRIIELPISARVDSIDLEAVRIIKVHHPRLIIKIEYYGCWHVNISKSKRWNTLTL